MRQHVAGLFWPESTQAQARTNLRRELHQLRAALPDADRFLAVDDTTVSWRDEAPCVIDVVQFERAAAEAEDVTGDDDAMFIAAAERAVTAYGGEFLPGFYDDWVLVERDRLRRGCMELLDRLAPVLAEQGEVVRALGHARRRVELEPLEERGYQVLMRLQARAGDGAAALRTFHRCVSVLDSGLGVKPSPGTVAVYEELFAQTHQWAAAPTAPKFVPLVGRDAELAALHQRWATVVAGPRMVVIAGEAGVGTARRSTTPRPSACRPRPVGSRCS